MSNAPVTSALGLPLADGGVNRIVFTASTALVTASSHSISLVSSEGVSGSSRGFPPLVLDAPAVNGERTSSLRVPSEPRAEPGADFGGTDPRSGLFSSRLASATPGDLQGAFFADFAPGVTRSAVDTGAMSDLPTWPEGAPATGGEPLAISATACSSSAGCNGEVRERGRGVRYANKKKRKLNGYFFGKNE